MGRNLKPHGKEDEKQRQRPHRQEIRQRQQAAEGGGDALPAVKAEENRENVPDHRRGNHKPQRCGVLAVDVQVHRQEALEQVPAQRDDAAPEAALLKGVGGAGIMVADCGGDVWLFQPDTGQPGKKETAAQIGQDDAEKILHHDKFLSE